MATNVAPAVKAFFDKATSSVQYVVSDQATRQCAIIDPVLDFDDKSGATATHSGDEILDYIDLEKLKVQWILDTHPHADHFSSAQYLKSRTGAPTAIGDRIGEVQQLWKDSLSPVSGSPASYRAIVALDSGNSLVTADETRVFTGHDYQPGGASRFGRAPLASKRGNPAGA